MKKEIIVAPQSEPKEMKSFADFAKYLRKKTISEEESYREELRMLVEWTLKCRPLSYSSLKKFALSPQHYIEYILDWEYEPTKPMILGNILDMMLLTPEDFDKTYIISPVFSGKGMKARKEAFMEKVAEEKKIVIDEEQYETALGMLESIYRDKDAIYYIDKMKHNQTTIYWKDPETGLKQVSKLDIEGDPSDDDFIADLKTASDSEETKFIRDAHNFGYHIQAGGYTLAMKRKFRRFPYYINIVVESKPPYAVNVFKATNEYIETSQKEYEYLLIAFDHCRRENLWHLGHAYWRLGTPYFGMKLPGYFKSKLGY